MSLKAGVWIDQKQARLVLLHETGQEFKRFSSKIERTDRQTSPNAYTRKDFVPEDRLERKAEAHLKAYFDEILLTLKAAEAILIIGPGEAKGEFQKRLQSQKSKATIEVAAADKMTDAQFVAKVTKHFGAAAQRSTGTKRIVKKVAKPAAVKPTKQK